jgi:hypothetical protein
MSLWLLGEVYLGVHLITDEEVAVKLEPYGAKHYQLDHEAHVYRFLADGVGVPYVNNLDLPSAFLPSSSSSFFFN